jgi:hypothetical protein
MIQRVTLASVTGTAGTIARFKSGGGLEISQLKVLVVWLLLVVAAIQINLK